MSCTTHHICDCKAKKLDEALEQIEKLKSALEFYGEAISHIRRHHLDNEYVYLSDIDIDSGKKARLTINELEKWEQGK